MWKFSTSPTPFLELSYSETQEMNIRSFLAKKDILFFHKTYARSSGVKKLAVDGKSTKTKKVGVRKSSKENSEMKCILRKASSPTATVNKPSRIYMV